MKLNHFENSDVWILLNISKARKYLIFLRFEFFTCKNEDTKHICLQMHIIFIVALNIILLYCNLNYFPDIFCFNYFQRVSTEKADKTIV